MLGPFEARVVSVPTRRRGSRLSCASNGHNAGTPLTGVYFAHSNKVHAGKGSTPGKVHQSHGLDLYPSNVAERISRSRQGRGV